MFVLLFYTVGGNKAPDSTSSFPDKHCFCEHKSEAPRKAGEYQILIG